MKKRFLAVLLCACLLVPFMSIAGVQVAAAEEKSYIIKELTQYISISPDLSTGGVFYTTSGGKMDAIDLSGADGYTFENVGIQMDTYVSGSSGFVNFFVTNKYRGQLEITSSGIYDEEEMGVNPGTVLRFKENEWVRVVVPLTSFAASDTPGTFDKSSFDYIRMYLAGGGQNYAGESGMLKIINWYLVDLSVPEEERPTTTEMPLGDGTFEADPPEFRKVEVGEGYEQSAAVYAGYDLKEYIDSHPDVQIKNTRGETDYSALVNSLLSGLSAHGGGALFIPAGEWEFRGEIVMPTGTTIVGEWLNPDENPQIRGTILKVYCGAGSMEEKPFLTMGAHTKVNNVAFWYPEQTVQAMKQYPPTIRTYHYTYVENVTLVNSYYGIQNIDFTNCPNAWNIYGTPLNIGLEFDAVIDIARIEEVHFSADYWADSGLPGAPSSGSDYDLLADQLYNYAIGITLRRMDWSYVTYSDIIGYNTGLLFDASSNGVIYPNGQCVGLNFTNCKYGHFSYGVSHYVESLLDITMKNCEYGIYSTGTFDGAMQYYNADIEATKYAVYQESAYTKLSVMASTIRKGRVYTENGSNVFINNQIRTSAPQIELDSGTVAAILIGNTDASGNPIKYTNPGQCTLSYDKAKAELEPYTAMTREEAKALVKAPLSSSYIIPSDLDTTGMTDVTEQIQTYLTQLGQNGGGTLFLTPGKYRIDGTFTIPSGVELRGSADFASIPKAINTVLMVDTPIENGKDEYTSTATVTMKKNSGMRGVIFNYPKQNLTYRSVDGSPTSDVQYYEFDFVPYPYTIRGTGSDIYVVNVTVRNGWNGVDFKTNRCDNHYIDYLAGHFLNRGIVIGGGSTGGYVRNYQFNYNSMLSPTNPLWSGFGGEPSTTDLCSAFAQPMQAQFNNNSIILQLGHVEDQLVYNCFNYACYIGVNLVEENGRAADARIFGHGVDYGTQPLKIEAAEHVEFTNLQLTSMNQAGENPGRWAVDESKTPLYAIWLTDAFEGEVTITNFSEWSSTTPKAAIRVDGGKLNIYNGQFSLNRAPLFEISDGVLNIVGFSTTRSSNMMLVNGQSANLHITAGFYDSKPVGCEDAGTFKYVYQRSYRYSVPKNVVFPENAEVVAVESFDDYTFSNTTTYRVDDLSATSIRRGAVRLRLNANNMMLGLKTGQNKNEAMPFALGSGTAKDIYRMEWRFNIAQMRNTADSEIYLFLSNANVKNQQVLTIKRDGSVYDQTNTKFATVAMGTDYRLAVEVDARDANNKTVTVYLLNDNSQVIAHGTTTALNKTNFQGTGNTVTGFWFAAMASPAEAPETETDFTVDYFYIIRGEESTLTSGKPGDVDGNGKIDSTDARLVLQYAVKKISTLNVAGAADVDGNNKIDSTDARLILQYAVGKIKSFPA